jgi:D-glycero-D-manno-heptose 1,7-bisphosphate phosphatase
MSKEKTRPAVFLDRDGTVIEERDYLSRPEQVRLLPGAAAALRDLKQAGFACVLITNQSGLGRGLFREADLSAVHAELTRQLTDEGAALDGIYYCSYAPTTADKTVIEHVDRKPGPGLLHRAARELNIDLENSWMVGDSISDALAGRHAGCRGSILVRTGHALADDLDAEWLILDDLAAAAKHILTSVPA